jgi:hypothetical protein
MLSVPPSARDTAPRTRHQAIYRQRALDKRDRDRIIDLMRMTSTVFRFSRDEIVRLTGLHDATMPPTPGRWPALLKAIERTSAEREVCTGRGWNRLAAGLGLGLRRTSECLDVTQPADQWVRTGENLVHHLQVVDSKRLKSPTHSVDRTAVPQLSARFKHGASARNRFEFERNEMGQ